MSTRVRSAALLLFLLGLGLHSNSQHVRNIGLAPALQDHNGTLQPAYQHTVWRKILKAGLEYDIVMMREAEFSALESLQTYTAIIIPSSRKVMTKQGLENFRAFVRQGGKLVRDMTALQAVDTDGDGVTDPGEITSAAGEILASYWMELAGSRVTSVGTNLLDTIRFLQADPRLVRNLPAEFVPTDLPQDAGLKYGRAVYYYALAGARPVVEGTVRRRAVTDLNTPAEKRQGAFPIVTINRYGDGYCLSLGPNLARALAAGIAGQQYRVFFGNLVSWLAATSPGATGQ